MPLHARARACVCAHLRASARACVRARVRDRARSQARVPLRHAPRDCEPPRWCLRASSNECEFTYMSVRVLEYACAPVAASACCRSSHENVHACDACASVRLRARALA
eukprot:6212531-Pleurochrysis_carterae.AAC.4